MEDDLLAQARWKDVTPIDVPEDDVGCARIAYDPDFALTMGYFRAILKLDEKSPRALELTARVIAGNAANYTAWFYRRECLFALGASLSSELEFVTAQALASPKNYQIWYHRRAIVDKLGDGSKELDFVAQILANDSKNYHAWSHRQFVLARFGLWDQELAYVEALLEADVRNNSAWNQRWFVVKNTSGFQDAVVRERELQYAFKQARVAPNNESPFNYIRGLMRLEAFSELEVVRTFAEGLLAELQTASQAGAEAHVNQAHPPPLLSLLVDVYARASDLPKAVALCRDLGEKYDTIRAKFWRYKAGKLQPASA